MLGLNAFQQLKLEITHHCLNYPIEHPEKKLCKKASLTILNKLGFTIISKSKQAYQQDDKLVERLTDKFIEEARIAPEDQTNYAEKVFSATISEAEFTKLLQAQIDVAAADDGRGKWNFQTGSSFHRDLRNDFSNYLTRKQKEQETAREQKTAGTAAAMSVKEVEALRESAAAQDEKVKTLTVENADLKDKLLATTTRVTELLGQSKGVEESEEYKKAKEESARLQGEAKDAFVAKTEALAQLKALQETHQQLQQERDSLAEQLQTAKIQAHVHAQQIADLQSERSAAPSVVGSGVAPSVSTSISGGGEHRTASVAARYENKYAEYKDRFSSHTSPYRLFVFEALLERYTTVKEAKGPGRVREWKAGTSDFIKSCFEDLIRDTFNKCGKPLNTQEWINAKFSEEATADSTDLMSLRATLLKPPSTSSNDKVAEQNGLTVRYYLSKMVSDGYYLPQNTKLGEELAREHQTIEGAEAYNRNAIRVSARQPVPVFAKGIATSSSIRKDSAAQLTGSQAHTAVVSLPRTPSFTHS